MTDAIKKQYDSLKAKHPDAIMLFRCGDFYESYETDAIDCANTLGITLTYERDSKTQMTAFPFHALDTYLPKLVRAGFRICICDPLEDPRQKKLVKRGCSEMVSPMKRSSE